MNFFITVVGISIVSLLFASLFFSQIQNSYEKHIFGQGYNVELSGDSDDATEQEKDAIENAEENKDNDN